MGEEFSMSPGKDVEKAEAILVIREHKSGIMMSLGLYLVAVTSLYVRLEHFLHDTFYLELPMSVGLEIVVNVRCTIHKFGF